MNIHEWKAQFVKEHNRQPNQQEIRAFIHEIVMFAFKTYSPAAFVTKDEKKAE